MCAADNGLDDQYLLLRVNYTVKMDILIREVRAVSIYDKAAIECLSDGTVHAIIYKSPAIPKI